MIHALRGFVLPGVTAATGILLLLSLFLNPLFWWGVVPMASVLVVGIYDVVQTRHNILRNYPILGHFRFILEDWGPELHQYFIESNKSGAPFDRDQRSLMYQRAKNVNDMKPFGSELNMYTDSYVWLTHSIAPKPVAVDAANTLRVEVGGDKCTNKYSASLFNISAMSFGSLSANAIMAMNAGAKKGGFAHNTGEGGISQYHREFGADLIWQIGTGYFGCRTKDGKFDPELFAKQAADDQVKMIELKLSQGAKPGHGGVLPAVKVSREIAEARGIPEGEECISPAAHSAFSTPIGLLEFISTLRELSGGKPVGFKLCVGDALELLSVFKAMLESRLLPDFITVDGAEGGTGAAPLEFCDHLGTPLYDGLFFVQNALVGIGLRDKLKIAASAKRTTSVAIASAMALGADWCNSARGFMFATGCIQAQLCHTNACPVGVTTQDKRLQRALVVTEKIDRVYNYHRNTVESLAEFIAAAGLTLPSELQPRHIWQRTTARSALSLDRIYNFLEHRQLLDGRADKHLQGLWNIATIDSFGPK